MGPDPFIGVAYHWTGGLAAASFYIPYTRVRGWAWETYWLVGGIFSWIIAPIVLASLLVPGLWDVLRASPPSNVGWAFLFGLLWGIGNLTFGLSMRYLGIGLGYAIALGLCTAFGTLIPPLFTGELGRIAGETSGRVILFAVGVCLAGIVLSGIAGVRKEREASDADKRSGAAAEFNLGKGLVVATFAGILSACFAFGLAAGAPIAAVAKDALARSGGSDLWQNLPVLVVVLLGGFTTNFLWCVALNVRNRTAYQYARTAPVTESAAVAGATDRRPSLGANYALSALAGVVWYLQFFFYSMGQTRMGKFEFSSWTLHMASIIAFSTLWGIALKEWKGTSRRTHLFIGMGLAVLIASTVIIGYGNYLKAAESPTTTTAPASH